MSKKAINSRALNTNTSLSRCNDGFWLYDKTRGMNLSMKAESAESALIEALSYYQKRLTEVETAYKVMDSKVTAFVSQFIEEESEE